MKTNEREKDRGSVRDFQNEERRKKLGEKRNDRIMKIASEWTNKRQTKRRMQSSERSGGGGNERTLRRAQRQLLSAGWRWWKRAAGQRTAGSEAEAAPTQRCHHQRRQRYHHHRKIRRPCPETADVVVVVGWHGGWTTVCGKRGHCKGGRAASGESLYDKGDWVSKPKNDAGWLSYF